MNKECELIIKPCPFCGDEDISVKILNNNESKIIILIKCANPECNITNIFSWLKNKKHTEWNNDIYIALSIRKWNKRADNSEKNVGTKIKLYLPEPKAEAQS